MILLILSFLLLVIVIIAIVSVNDITMTTIIIIIAVVAVISIWIALHWRHNDHDDFSNHQPHCCLLNLLFRHRSKKTSKLRVTGLCVGNSPWPVNSPHKWPVTRRMFPFDDVIMRFGINNMNAYGYESLWVTDNTNSCWACWCWNLNILGRSTIWLLMHWLRAGTSAAMVLVLQDKNTFLCFLKQIRHIKG